MSIPKLFTNVNTLVLLASVISFVRVLEGLKEDGKRYLREKDGFWDLW